MAARQVERAVHDPGPWTMRVEDVAYPASRWIGEDWVLFRAHLPEVCWLASDETIFTVDLLCRGEVVGSRQVQFNDGDTVLDWKFVLSVPEPAQA